MNTIVDKFADEAGVTEVQAQRALEVLIAEVRGRMPPKMVAKLKRMLAGQDFYGGSWFAALKNRYMSR
jgi:hypothetical protein